MDNRLQLFVERQNSPGSFVEVDRFNDESVNVVDSIQDVKDISKIFSPFTRAFHLPSSPTNDDVFGYYYNNQVDTYDARFRTRAIIKISGADYKVGHISMDNSTMINSNSATSYRVKFTDETTTLKEKIGDDKLTNLNYGKKIKLNNNLSTIVNGIRQGVYRSGSPLPGTPGSGNPNYDADDNVLYPDVIYAPIFTKGKAVPVPFRSTTTAPTSNDYQYFLAYFDNENSADGVTTYDDATERYKPNAVNARDYRPSVKVSTIMELINDKYALGFSDEFMYREELDQLYLWHNGKIQSDLQGSNAFSGEGLELSANSIDLTLNSFQANTGGAMKNYRAGDNDLLPTTVWDDRIERLGLSELTIFLDKGGYTGTIGATVSLVVLPSPGLEKVVWSTTIANLDDNEGSTDEGTVFNSSGASAYEDTPGYRYWRDEIEQNITRLTFRITLNSSSAISSNTSIAIKTDYHTILALVNTSGGSPIIEEDNEIQTSNSINITTGTFIDLKGLAPDMKILEFVAGIFKMFNLTYQSEDRFTTNVQTIDEFYNNPTRVDISEHVTLEGATVSKAMIYKDITMMYNKSEDAMSGQYQPRANGELFPDVYKKLNSNNTGSVRSYGSDATAEGNNLSIKSPFTCMMFERLYTSWSDEGWDLGYSPYVPTFDSAVNHAAPNAITDVVVGHSIDSDLKKKDIKNLLFYGKKVDITRNFKDQGKYQGGDANGVLGILDEFNAIPEFGNSAGSQGRLVGLYQTGLPNKHTLVLVDDNGDGNNSAGEGYGAKMDYLRDPNSGANIGEGTYKNQWWNPSNIMASKFRRNGLYMNADAKIQGLQFNNENTDEYEYKSWINSAAIGQTPIYNTVFRTDLFINGLYDTFYKSYLEGLYDKSRRLYKIKAKMPDHLIATYEMNDLYRIGNKEFTINKANINLMNGESTLELLTHIPPAGDAAVINSGSFQLSPDQFYDESIEFDLTSIRVINNNFPDSIRIITGTVNNNYEYVIDGLVPSDFGIPVGPGIYQLLNIVTPHPGSGQPNWIRSATNSDVHIVCAQLEHSNGTTSKKSNQVAFRNSVDTIAPTGNISVVATSSTIANVTVAATDNTGGSGVGRVKITSTVFGESTITQVNQPYNGDPTTFQCSVTAGTFNTFVAKFTDNSNNESIAYIQSISVVQPDVTPPEEPTLSGSTNYTSTGDFNIDLEIGNIYDNEGVDYVTIMRSINGAPFTVLHTEDPGNNNDLSYRDADLDDDDGHRYLAFVTDDSGNTSTTSNMYEYQGDPEGDL